jgi:carbon monoxide dehydrogenase subunit G
MRLKGNQIVHAVPSRVWEILMNPHSLARVVPGITSLEKISENSFKATVNIRMGPVNGMFSGNLQLEDITKEKSFTLKTLQISKMGNAKADVQIKLAPIDDNQTEVMFDGDVILSGMLASMGQRLIGGIAQTLTKQFFDNLQHELAVTTV